MEAEIIANQIIISAVNITEGGALTILRDCLSSASQYVPQDWEITAIVNNSALINESRIRLIPIPSGKKSWALRLYWEWFGFMRISREMRPKIWLSLHDITPRIFAERRVVYCHNPSPFYKISLQEAIADPKFLLFNLFYKYLYRINITLNYAVIVQQEWLRDQFKKLYGPLNIVVSHPHERLAAQVVTKLKKGRKKIFIYPALPRVFKNIELLCKAAEIHGENDSGKYEIRFTIDGSEGKYARQIVERYKAIKSLKFIGRQTPNQMQNEYELCDVVLFPSKLETWGLPISEAKKYGKPILAPKMDYAYETVGAYQAVSFLDAGNPNEWADAIKKICNDAWIYSGNNYDAPSSPSTENWQQLWGLLLDGL